MQHIHQIRRCQRNGREGIAAAWLDAHTDMLTKLVVDSRHLRLAGRNGHGCVSIHLLNLAIDALQHRLISAIFLLENLDKLL